MPKNRKPKRSHLNALRRLAEYKPGYFQHQYEVRSGQPLFEEISDAQGQREVQVAVEEARPAVRPNPRQARPVAFGSPQVLDPRAKR